MDEVLPEKLLAKENREQRLGKSKQDILFSASMKLETRASRAIPGERFEFYDLGPHVCMSDTTGMEGIEDIQLTKAFCNNA